MGLNLAALNSLSTKTSTTETKHATTPSPKPEVIHNAPSQSTQVSNSLASLTSLSNRVSQPEPKTKEATTIQQSNQSGGVSTAKQIKYQEISDNIFALREAIHSAHPKMPGLLQEIWRTLQSYPEQVTLLEEDQMEIIISGLEKVVDTDLANITIKAATSGKKGKASITTASLGF